MLPLLASLSVFLALLLAALGLRQAGLGQSAADRRIRALRSEAPLNREAVILRQVSSIPAMRSLLTHRAWAERASLDLERANLHLRVGEYLAARALLAAIFVLLGLMMVGFQTPGLLLGVPLGALGFMLPAVYVQVRKRRRQRAIEGQLVETVTLIANGVSAGFGFLQSVQAAAGQISPPIADELNHLVQDINLGVSAQEALLDMGRRVGSDDLNMVITAIIIQRTTGGNLAEILDNVAETMREREQIQGEINTLTAEKRLTGNVLSVYPAILAALLFLIEPRIMSTLWTETAGIVLLVIAGVLQAIGFIIIRRIVTIDF
jgi:tight adherence protein B